MITSNKIYEILVVVLSLVCVYLIALWAFDKFYWAAVLMGWAISFVNHLADISIKRMGAQGAQTNVFQKLSAANLTRFVILLFLVFVVLTLTDVYHLAFVYSLLSSYIIFMTFDLIHFYQLHKDKT